MKVAPAVPIKLGDSMGLFACQGAPQACVSFNSLVLVAENVEQMSESVHSFKSTLSQALNQMWYEGQRSPRRRQSVQQPVRTPPVSGGVVAGACKSSPRSGRFTSPALHVCAAALDEKNPDVLFDASTDYVSGGTRAADQMGDCCGSVTFLRISGSLGA
jgi:hypothetical protein